MARGIHIDTIHLFKTQLDEHRFVGRGRFFSHHAATTAIVSVITITDEDTQSPLGPGCMIDWTAYIGSAPGQLSEVDTMLYAATNGAKLSADDAKHFFPDLPIRHYRV